MRAARAISIPFVIVGAVFMLFTAQIARGACGAQITAIRVFDAPDQYQRAYMEVDYSLVGSAGGIGLFVDGANWDGGSVSGTGTFGRFVGPLLACTTPGEHTYSATLHADCGAQAPPTSVSRPHEPRPTVSGTIAGFNDEKTLMTVSADYKFPYISSGAGGRARVLQVYVDGRFFGENVLQPGDPWQGTKTWTFGGTRCLGTGSHVVSFGATTSCESSLPSESSAFHIKQAEITSFTLQPVNGAGTVRATIGHKFEATQNDERGIQFTYGPSVWSLGVQDISGTITQDFQPGCLAPGSYTATAKAIACRRPDDPLFTDVKQTALSVPVKKGNIDIEQVLDPTTSDIKLALSHTLPEGVTSATRTVRVLSLVGDNGVVIPGSVIRGPETVTSTPASLEFAYTPPFWARTIRFQATLSFCNGQTEAVTTVECPNSCGGPQPPTASPHPVSYADGNARYSDSDPLPTVLDSFQLVRNYDSHHRVLGLFGRGWVSMFDNRLLIFSDAGGDTISLTDEQNESFMFLRRNGGYAQIWPKGRTSVGTLTFESSTSLYVHRPAGAMMARLYRASDGRFVGYRQLGTGREMQIDYDANGYPVSVKDSWTDVTWTITVNSTTGRVTAIASGSLTWQYQYANDNRGCPGRR